MNSVNIVDVGGRYTSSNAGARGDAPHCSTFFGARRQNDVHLSAQHPTHVPHATPPPGQALLTAGPLGGSNLHSIASCLPPPPRAGVLPAAGTLPHIAQLLLKWPL